MSKALVAFGSLTGNTADVAGWIVEALTAEGLTAEAVDCGNVASPVGLCAPL